MNLVSVAFAGMLLVAEADPRDGAANKELKAIQGKWEVSQVSISGTKETDAQVKDRRMSLEFKGGRHIIRSYGGVDEEGTFSLDPGLSPKSLDLESDPGMNSVRAIYEIDGDTLRIAFFLFSDKRPTHFDGSKEDKKLGLMVFVAKRLRS